MRPAKIRKRVFFGCEGDSERSYVKWLQNILDQEGYFFTFDAHIAGGGDPLAIVEESLKIMKKQERRGKYSFKAILLDSDRLGQCRERDQRIQPLITKANVDLIYQVCDHEALLLRHYPNQHTKNPPQGGASETALKVHWPEYRKPATAIDLGKRLGADHLRSALRAEKDLMKLLTSMRFE